MSIKMAKAIKAIPHQRFTEMLSCEAEKKLYSTNNNPIMAKKAPIIKRHVKQLPALCSVLLQYLIW